jgi:hypothetical protein
MAKLAFLCAGTLLALAHAASYGQTQTTFRIDKPATGGSSGAQQLIFKLDKPNPGIMGAKVFLADATTAGKPGTFIGTVSFYPSNADGPVEFVLPLHSAVRSASLLKVTPIPQSGGKATSQKLVVMKAAIVPADNAAFR